ncbi:SOS response-associated peptidase family protein [Streptomyces sp900105245]|uniref:SOS response-associated peptidase family protein n=1 Tax=Streptomyces sp. 900105245 TaxID=3154379 RepID=A0ABV1UKE1_9ACTN
MCGRYVSTRRPQDLTQLFHADEWPTAEALASNWNVAPADGYPVVPPQPGAEQHPRRPGPGIR